MHILRPDLIQIFTTDIRGRELGSSAYLFSGRRAIPSGWVSSPSYFKLHTDAIEALNKHFRPNACLLSGSERLDSSIYVDDCMMAERPVGNRSSSRIAYWEWCCRRVLGGDSVKQDKRKSRGDGLSVI